MDEVLSHDLGKINGDFENNDSDIDQEEEENRQREIQGLLDEQFNSISTISGEDEDEESDDPDRIFIENKNDGITSTPLSKSQPRIKETYSNFGIIPEESINGSFEDPPENAGKELDQTGDGLHVKYLLDQNNHLSAETSRLKHHYSVVAGDYEGLKFKYQQLEDELDKKDRDLVQYGGNIAALEMQVQAEAEAKKEYARKFSLAESTIQSLQRQMSELSKSDCLVRLQSNHDTLVKKIKEDHENELFALREKIEDLVINLENKQSRIQELEKELKNNVSQISEFRRRSNSDLTKSSPTTSKNTALFESLQSIKKELESAMTSNQELRSQIESMKKQITEYKNQNSDLSTILREKDLLINDLRAVSRKSKNLDYEMGEKYEKLVQKLKVKEELAESRATQISQLEKILESAKNEIVEYKTSNKELHDKFKISKSESKPRQDLFTQDEVHSMVKEATEDWRRSTEASYQEQYMRQMKKLEISYENSKQEIVRDTRNRVMNQLKKSVEILCSWVRGLAANGDEPSDEELMNVLTPIRDLWIQIVNSFKMHTRNLISKREEAAEAKRELEQAYVSTLNQPHPDVESLYKELEEVKKKLDEQGEKLKKYKSMCRDLQLKKSNEVERLKTEFTELLKSKKKHFEEREMKLKNQLITQWNEKCHNIDQAFADALKDVKNQADDILEQTQRKSRDLLMVAVKTYHEAVVGKINTQAPSSLTSNASHEDRIVSKEVCVF